jgi:CO/xanthine dehydrogenase Mo-binding subunit
MNDVTAHGHYPMAPPASERRVLGHAVPRIEDLPLVTGRGRYAGDINFPHQLHMRIVRSPKAHGKIIAIDTAAARALPGVYAVWTNADIAKLSPIDFRADKSAEGIREFRQPALAKTYVRYVGDPVAAVFAEDPYVAEDAAELVTIELEELPAVLSASDPPGEFEPGRSSEAIILRHSYGDIETAFRDAHAVIEIDVETGRHSGVPLETRGAIGRYDTAKDLLELHGAAKIPHRNRETLCRMLNRSPSALHVHESHVGGGFGIRGELYPEDVLVLVAAMRFERPVKWIEDRREHLMCANQGRQQRHKARIAVDKDGLILGIEDEIFHDQGAYIRTHGVNVPNRTMYMLSGCYKVPAYRAMARVRLTNKTPCATYRAPGRFESTFVRSRLMDAVADKLGLDRIEVRRRNLIPAAEMPYMQKYNEPGIEELDIDSGDYALLLDKALAAFGWNKLQQDLKRRRAAGELVGAGLAFFLEESGRGPSDGRSVRCSRADHRRRLDRAGLPDRDGADLCRGARRRLQARARDPWPDRLDRPWHRGACGARDRTHRWRCARHRHDGAREGARICLRAAADACRRARYRRWHRNAQERQRRPFDHARRDRQACRARLEISARPHPAACRAWLVQHPAYRVSLWRPPRGGVRRSRHWQGRGRALHGGL